jgi:hypothetical protein
MIGHFKDKLDVFGRGFNYIPDKFNGVADYKYSIAIENSVIPDYFTEKLFECFLTYTMPIYYGCPNIGDYFDERSFILIDIDDYKNSILKIEEAIEGDLYKRSLPYIEDARKRFLEQYHVFAALANILRSQNESSPTVPNMIQHTTILPELTYESHNSVVHSTTSKRNTSLFAKAVSRLVKRL